jgi:hypothetical protein
MKDEILAQTTRAVPAVAGAGASALTLNQWVMIGTGVYLVIQALYLLRKWYREEQEWARRPRQAEEAREV